MPQRHHHNGNPSSTNRVSEHFRQGYEATSGLIATNPASSALVLFGIGCGLGLLLTHLLAKPQPPQNRVAAFGRDIFDTVRSKVPNSLWRLHA